MDIPGRPKLPATPLELLNSPGIGPGILQAYYTPIVGGVLGFLGIIVSNWASKRPVISGIQKHVIATSIGIACGYYFEKYRNEQLALRDAMFRNYIELHPDDFPPYERVKYRDVLEKWTPIR